MLPAPHPLRPSERSLKQTLRAVGAAGVSLALIGVFALPAHATSPASSQLSSSVYAQVLSTSELAELAIPAELPAAEEQPVVVAPAAAIADGTSARSAGHVADVPAGVGAQGIVNAALAQLGVSQDCTDLVQNSLAAVGLATRRDQGGYDHGPWSLQGLGAPVTDGQWAPGDILGWPGYPHVAIYIGDGLAVHGGMGGSTVVGSATGYFGTPTYVVRPA